MRILFIVLAFICVVLGVIFTVLPTEKLGLIPTALALILSFLAIKKTGISQKGFPKFILIFASILLIVGLAKIFLIKDEVVINKQDEIQKVESQKEDKKDLEELDEL